ncbi:MAG TPA: head-tail connector protein [Candidatus Desulfobacillus denitrificans]|nr:head-tail connector protein [Candidatus Desulfobacillus denitrificans]
MTLKLIAAPSTAPVTVSEAKTHLRVDVSDDDTYIDTLIAVATRIAEDRTGRALMTQTWDLLLDAFPAAEIMVGKLPIQSITHVKYYDPDSALQTIDSADYVLDPDVLPGWVLPAYGLAWPATLDSANVVMVRFVAGYADAASVPAPIRQWILLSVGQLYQQREPVVVGASVAALPRDYCDALLDPYRLHFL